MKKNVTHLTCNFFGVGIDSRVMPGVNPIHHAKQAQHRNACGELQRPFPLQFV
jgi:hypothetical protein